MYKIIGADQKEYGPISGEQIRQWISEGRANGQSQVCLDGTQDWKPLAAFPEFGLAAAPVAVEGTGPAKPPAAIKVFGVLNIIFGSLGILCTPLSVVAISINKQIHYNSLMMGWFYLSAVIGVIGGLLMLTSGIGLLKLQSWARRLAVYYAMFACFIALVNPIITLNNLPESSVNPAAQKIGAIVGAVIGVLIGLTYNGLLIAFLSRRSVKQALGEND